MSAAAIRRFVAHYERLTLWLFESMPAQADMLAVLDDAHGLAELVAGGAAEGLGVVHLLGLGRRHHEGARRGGPGDVAVVVGARRQQY